MDLTSENVARLKDLVTTAVVSASASAAWLTFWFGREDKHEESLNRELRVLNALHRQLETIHNWAGAEYGQDSHDVMWLNPFWSVLGFPSVRIERFPQTTAATFFGPKLAQAVVDLRAAIEQFRALLMRHNQFLGAADQEMRARLLTAVQPYFPQQGGSGITLKDAQALPGLSNDDRAWLGELYRMNKEVHTLGIGKAGETGKLHQALSLAMAEVVRARKTAGRRNFYSWLGWIGHAFAFVFVVTAIYFLVAATSTLFNSSSQRQGLHEPVGRHSTTTKAKSNTPESADTNATHPPGPR